MKLLSILLIVVCLAGEAVAQNPEIDSLRKRMRANPDVGVIACELCEAFVRYTMPDSARICLNRTQLRRSNSDEIKIRAQLTASRIETITYQYKRAKVHYDSALRIMRSGKPSFRTAQNVYETILVQSAFFADCDYGSLLADEFIRLCQKQKNDSLYLVSIMQKARFLECQAAGDSAHVALIEEAEELCFRHPELYGAYYELLGNHHYYFGRLPKSIEFCLLAENAYRQNNDLKRLEGLYGIFVSAYEEMSDFDRALQYMLLAQPMVESEVDETWAEYYNTLGWIYYRLGMVDSALSAIRTSSKHHKELTPGNPELAYPIGNLGLIFKALGELDSAKMYSNRAIELFTILNLDNGVAEALNNLGAIALEESQVDLAIQYFDRALQLLEENVVDRYEEMKSLEGLYLALQDRDPKRAIRHFQRFTELKIALLSKEEALKALQLEAEFYQDRNEDRIRELKYESQLKSLEIEQKNNRILLTSFALLFMIFVSGLIFFYWLQRRSMIASLEESNMVNERIISMISHDFRGPLNNVKVTLELLQSKDMDINEFMIISKDLYRQSSDLSLMFDSFVGWAISQRDGYLPAKVSFKWSVIVDEVISLSEPLAKLKNIRIKLKALSDVHLETDRMAASLILRNLLANAIKYSHDNSSIEIEYFQEENWVHTSVRDYGIGISQDKLHRLLTTGDGSTMGTKNEYGAGLGLRMVIRYIKSIGGSIKAESEKGKGTKFMVSIPLTLTSTR
ncbi:MAG: tetratricopeptide repeat-containing sensor histidine kinase [Cryomorphaceae bacterium]